MRQVPINPVIQEETQTPLVTQQQPPITILCANHDTETNEFRKEQSSVVSTDNEIEQSMVDDDCTVVNYQLPFIAGPALQVLSVSILKPDHSHFRVVSGQVSITDPNTSIKYYIYNGDKDKLQPGWNELLLTCIPLAPVMGGDIHFELTSEDATATVPIFNHKYDMNKATRSFVNGILTLEGDGNCGYGCKVLFTNTPFAAIARVDDIHVIPPSSPPPGEEFFLLHGKVEVNTIVCSQTKREEALKGKYDWINSIPIQNAVYVVRFGLPLTLDVELYSEDRVLTKRTVQASSSASGRFPCFRCEASGFFFRVESEWYIPYNFFSMGMQQKLKSLPSPLYKMFGPPVSGALVEVFSVFFGGGKSAAPCDIDLYGAVVVTDGDKHLNILSGKKDLPCKLPSSSENDEQQFRTLALKWPDDWWVTGDNFGMKFELKDVKNNLLCASISSWRGDLARYDMRLCDVIEGENGHLAALHYSVFKNGKKAKICVNCSNGPYSIYGTVFAQYNNYDYSSTYEKQCYRSMLFRRSEELPLVVKCLQIPLLKSQVSAPSDCSELTVCVDLWVRPLRESFPHKRFTFNTNGTGSCNMIWGSLMVKVEWSGFVAD